MSEPCKYCGGRGVFPAGTNTPPDQLTIPCPGCNGLGLDPESVKADHERNRKIIRNMIADGGSFVAALGRAAEYADESNLSKIFQTWPELKGRYDY